MRRNRHSAITKHQCAHCFYRQVSRIDEQLFQRTDRLIFFPYDPLISKQGRLVPYVRQVSVNFFPCAERRLQRRKIPQNMYVLFAGNFHSGQHGDPVFLPGGDCLRQIQCGVVIGQRNRVQAQHFRHPYQIPWGHFIIPAGRQAAVNVQVVGNLHFSSPGEQSPPDSSCRRPHRRSYLWRAPADLLPLPLPALLPRAERPPPE